MMRSRRRMVPPLDEVYGLLLSPWPRQKVEALLAGDEQVVGNVKEEMELGAEWRLISARTLESIAETIEQGVDDYDALLKVAAPLINAVAQREEGGMAVALEGEFTDRDAEQLLVLLAKYVRRYPDSAASGEGVADIAEDMAMSMDVTSDLADRCRVEIEQAFKDHR